MPATTSRFVVGIDLGTTNSALSYVDSRDTTIAVQSFAIAQEIAVGERAAREVLPSFIYYPPKGAGSVGNLARQQASLTPGRVIASAKSWLCHDGVDRTAAILPWQGAEDIQPLSPLAATTTLLRHIVKEWNAAFSDYPLQEQDVVLTVPASFDEVARNLTVQAAAAAGIKSPVLLEEPQAAFYAWLERNSESWQEHLKAGQTVLVCDIGGGTSDFSLIAIVEEEGGKLGFERRAVGQHLLLGGDNLDLAIAHRAEAVLAGEEKLSPRDWGVLVAAAQRAKEQFFSDAAPNEITINLAGGGRSLVGASRTTVLQRREVTEELLQGFLPAVARDERPALRSSGFQEFGLPYASDSAISKHLAAFLAQTLEEGTAPDVVLFNGGFFESDIFRQRVLDMLQGWFERDITALHVPRLDLAVSQGAASYAMVRRGWGQRIGGGLPHSSFVEIVDRDAQRRALCIAPAGMDEGQTHRIDSLPLRLKINQPVQFGLYTAPGNRVVPAGTLIESEGLRRGNSLRTLLKIGKKKKRAAEVTIALEAKLSAIGILELWCCELEGDRKWRLEFDPRAVAVAEEGEDSVAPQGCDEATLARAREAITAAFIGEDDLDGLFKFLEELLGASRWQWNIVLLRQLFGPVYDCREGRRRSAKHEMRWLYLAGFCLRPGFGVAIDDWRVKQMWEIFHAGVIHHRNQQCMSDWWLLFNRIAGGLSGGQQQELAKEPLARFKSRMSKSNLTKMKAHEAGEFWRLIGSLERLAPSLKLELMEILLKIVAKEGAGAARGSAIWALGRLGARVPLYGPLNSVVSSKQIRRLMDEIVSLKNLPPDALVEIAMIGRLCDDRFRDLDTSSRLRLLRFLKESGAKAHTIDLVERHIPISEEESGIVFGEGLPSGLRVE